MEACATFFRIGPRAADPAALMLSDGDSMVHLRSKLMELLAAFATHPGEVLSKRELLDLVWPDVTVGDASLTVAIREKKVKRVPGTLFNILTRS